MALWKINSDYWLIGQYKIEINSTHILIINVISCKLDALISI